MTQPNQPKPANLSRLTNPAILIDPIWPNWQYRPDPPDHEQQTELAYRTDQADSPEKLNWSDLIYELLSSVKDPPDWQGWIDLTW